MAIKSRLSVLMGIKRYNIQDVRDKTGLTRTTISHLYHDKAATVDLEVLNKLCALFECRVEDLLEISNEEIRDFDINADFNAGGKFL